MDYGYTMTGEIRQGKGNKKIRFGPFYKNASGKKETRLISPMKKAINNLKNIFGKEYDEKTKESLTNWLYNATQIRYMNMKVLKYVIDYQQTIGNQKIDSENFSYEIIEPYINNILVKIYGKDLNKYDETQQEIFRYRLAQTFVRYIIYLENVADELQNKNFSPNTNITYDTPEEEEEF